MTLSVLSQSSVDKLRKLTQDGIDISTYEFGDLCENFNLVPLDLEIDFDHNVELSMPVGITQELNADLENCLKMSEIFPNLSEIEATDERIWTTLCLNQYKKYAIARWPVNESVGTQKHILNHWFAPNIRSRMRDNAVSRLWWYRRLCERIDSTQVEVILRLVFFNSDYRSSMLERNSSSAITSVVSTILKITEENARRGVIFKRDCFRDFMKKVDFIAGRSRLAVLNESQLKEKLNILYLEAYDAS